MADIRYVVQVLEAYPKGMLGSAQPFWKELKSYRKQEDAMNRVKELESAGHRARIYERDLDDE